MNVTNCLDRPTLKSDRIHLVFFQSHSPALASPAHSLAACCKPACCRHARSSTASRMQRAGRSMPNTEPAAYQPETQTCSSSPSTVRCRLQRPRPGELFSACLLTASCCQLAAFACRMPAASPLPTVRLPASTLLPTTALDACPSPRPSTVNGKPRTG